MDREQLKTIMPHREPMLLLDSAAATDEASGEGSYTVTGKEFFLQGHYPDMPIVPGVILCEIMAQSCCVVLDKVIAGGTPLFSGIDKVRIRGKVVPGDTFTTKVTKLKEVPPFYFFDCKGYVGGKQCISGELGFAIVKTSPKQLIS